MTPWEVSRLLTGAALTIDGRAGNRLGKPCGERGVACDIDALLAGLHHTAGNHILDQRGVEVVALNDGLQHFGEEINWVPILELASALASRRADRVDNDGRGHG